MINFFIKHLGPNPTKNEFYDAVKNLFALNSPSITPEEDLELFLESKIDELYVPFNHHYDLYKLIRKALIKNYQSYDMDKIFADRMDYRFDNFISVAQNSFMVIGTTGGGKTTFTEVIRILINKKVKFAGLNFTHIPILKVECPSKKSTKDLCINILTKIWDILEVDEKKRNIKGTEIVLKKRIEREVANHKIGLILIDEAHNLLSYKNNKAALSFNKSEDILTFIKSFSNETQIPIGFIGIPGTEDILRHLLQTGRRMTGEGVFKFPDLSPISKKQVEREMFNIFMNELWKIQVPGKEQKLTDEIKYTYFICSLGIPDLLKKIHKYCLSNLIDNPKKSIVMDKGYIISVVRYYLIEYHQIANQYSDFNFSSLLQEFIHKIDKGEI